MTGIAASTQAYEGWLSRQLGSELVRPDLDRKHEKMREGPFPFLRATYWRFAERILTVCPELAQAPAVLAIGDTHLENFGTWRDAEGRLVWGANDFDEAAEMPYALDLVRLAASAILARRGGTPRATEICEALLTGYRAGLDNPAPVILERKHNWLRKAVLLPERERADFWDGIAALEPADPTPRFKRVLLDALPQGAVPQKFAPRTAGTGSLGRPRFVVCARWRGGPVIREAKALLASAWTLAHGPPGAAIRAGEIAAGPFRAPDPHYVVDKGIVVRRLSPNSRKLEVKKDPTTLLDPRLLTMMGLEIANCHAPSGAAAEAVPADLKGRGPDWLQRAAKAIADDVVQEFEAFA